MKSMNIIQITKPDDWHIHLRQDHALQTTVVHAAKQFKRALVMPNTIPPITKATQALKYQKEILNSAQKNNYADFNPIMTLYLTDNTTHDDIKTAAQTNNILGYKLYPQGATTNSDCGVSNIKKIYNALAAMENYCLPLFVHGEVTDHNVDIFDRESVFIDNTLQEIRTQFPNLKITLEHITTKHAVDFVLAHRKNTAATITPHHLLLNRNDLLVGGIKPHYYCLPILKNSQDQQAIIGAALSGESCFFAGSDSAPHAKETKENQCGCAGIYYGPHTVEIYTDFFDRYNNLDKLEAFVSFHGADYYNLPRNNEIITLQKTDHIIPEYYNYKNSTIIPFYANKKISWKLQLH